MAINKILQLPLFDLNPVHSEKERRAAYYQRNKERIRANSSAYYHANKEAISAKSKKIGPRKNPWLDPEHRKKQSEAHKGHAGYWTGKKLSPEHREKLSAAHKANPQRYWLNKKCLHSTGEKNPGYIDGRYPERRKQRHTMEYQRWRREVFQRDDYTCQMCHIRGGKLHADHIKPFAKYPELRFDMNNGRTLCAPCHRQTPTWGRKALYV